MKVKLRRVTALLILVNLFLVAGRYTRRRVLVRETDPGERPWYERRLEE